MFLANNVEAKPLCRRSIEPKRVLDMHFGTKHEE